MTAPNKHSGAAHATVILERRGRFAAIATIVGICCLSARRFAVFVAANSNTRQPGCSCEHYPDLENTRCPDDTT